MCSLIITILSKQGKTVLKVSHRLCWIIFKDSLDDSFCSVRQPNVFCDDHTSCSKRHTSDEEKPFKCKECDKRFHKESLLKSHAKVHSDEKPFVCQYDSCNFRTKMLCSLKVHIRGVHEKERPYKCQNCNSAYLNISHLKRHLKVCSPRG